MIKFIFLGLVQGVTEFFPVSSSAHLLILQRITGVCADALALSVILHLGTALALVVFFFKDILGLLRDMRALFLIAVVTVVTGVIGIAGKDFFESLFSSPKAAAAALLVTGLILLATKKIRDTSRDMLDIKDALILGFMQAVAIIPGISRSGITISTLLFRKIDRQTVFKFSFLAAIPVILGAALLEFKKIGLALAGQRAQLSAGFIVSFISGLAALWALRSIISRAKLYYFGYYCIVVSIVTLIFIK